MILSSEDWDEGLPGTIEAVVFASEAARPRASSVHESFLLHFGRTAHDTPLLHLSWGEEQPFRDASWDVER